MMMFGFTPLIAEFTVSDLPAVNASLNALATVLLLAGYTLIRRGREQAHKRVMLTAFAVSVAFLVCYLVYHNTAGHVEFSGPSPVREFYYGLLLTHVVLAVTVPFLAVGTIYLGLKDRRAAHRRLARWTFPIWLYVSITGVVIYVMLYHLFPPPPEQPTMLVSGAATGLDIVRSDA